MNEPVNSKILGSDQIFKLFDKNGNGRIEENELNEMTSIFGLKERSTAINEKKVQNYEQKASLLTSVLMQNDSVTIDGDENVVIVTHGDENESSITIPEDKTGTFTADGNNFPEEIQLSMIKKGLDPAAVAKAGFSTVDQKVVDGKTIMTLRSADGYNLEISDQQVMTEMLEDGTEKVITDSKGNPKMATIARDENGNLVLDGVQGSLTITPSTAKSHEVILSNIHDAGREDKLKIFNKAQVPLIKTFPADRNTLSYDAARELDRMEFPSEEAHSGGFDRLSIIESPSGETRINLTSSKHGFVLNTRGDSPSPQPKDMSMRFADVNGTKTLIIKGLTNVDLDITEDGAKEHNLNFSNVDRVHAENKTTKPVNLKELVMHTDDGVENDNSSFTYSTQTNFDTFQREYAKHLTTSIHTDGLFMETQQRTTCASCHKSHDAWYSGKGVSFGAIDVDKEWGVIAGRKEKITLAPNKDYLIKPQGYEYTEEEKVNRLSELNKANIEYIDLHDYISTGEASKLLQEQTINEATAPSEKTKIGRSDRSWNGIKVQYKTKNKNVNKNIVFKDNHVEVKGNRNVVIATFGNDNKAHIGPDQSGKLSQDARTILYEGFHINPEMISQAGFNDVQLVRDSNGDLKELVLTNKDGTKLTMPSDEAYLFSEQMSVKKINGVYEISGLVGTLDGKGMKIKCTKSDVCLNIIERDPANGEFLVDESIENDDKSNAVYVNYRTVPAGRANVFRLNSDGEKVRVRKEVHDENGKQVYIGTAKKYTDTYTDVEITFIDRPGPNNDLYRRI